MTRRPDQRSDKAKAYRPWYNTTRWRKIAAHQKSTEPLCRMCLAQGIVEPMYACDHIEPHNGDEAKFWSGPFQSLCRPHHNGTKQREEARDGVSGAVDIDGWPVDRVGHPFYK